MVRDSSGDSISMGALRVLGTVLNRMGLRGLGKTFDGMRDMTQALGYKKDLGSEDYAARYARNGVSNRLVNIFPKATWAAGCEVIEIEDPFKITPFEQEMIDLDEKVHFWNAFLRADVLAGLDRYSVIVIGAPGAMDAPLSTPAKLHPFPVDNTPPHGFVPASPGRLRRREACPVMIRP